jgi:hypothetical protein
MINLYWLDVIGKHFDGRIITPLFSSEGAKWEIPIREA